MLIEQQYNMVLLNIKKDTKMFVNEIIILLRDTQQILLKLLCK